MSLASRWPFPRQIPIKSTRKASDMFKLAPYQLFICLCIINSFDNFLVVIVIQHYPRCSGDKDKWPHIATKEKLNSVASGWKTEGNHSGCLE